jgi:hypothetical protein
MNFDLMLGSCFIAVPSHDVLPVLEVPWPNISETGPSDILARYGPV